MSKKQNPLPKPTTRSLTCVPQELVDQAGKELALSIGPVPVRKGSIPTEELEARISHRLDLIHRYLTDETVLGRLAFTSYKDITVAEAIYMDKLMALRGQPSIIVGHATHKRLDELGPALIAELTKRGIKAPIPTIKEPIDVAYSAIDSARGDSEE